MAREESNLRTQVRSLPLYPLSYGAWLSSIVDAGTERVADGIRTRDHRDHNPGLYQLSYRHRVHERIAASLRRFRAARGCDAVGG